MPGWCPQKHNAMPESLISELHTTTTSSTCLARVWFAFGSVLYLNLQLHTLQLKGRSPLQKVIANNIPDDRNGRHNPRINDVFGSTARHVLYGRARDFSPAILLWQYVAVVPNLLQSSPARLVAIVTLDEPHTSTVMAYLCRRCIMDSVSDVRGYSIVEILLDERRK